MLGFQAVIILAAMATGFTAKAAGFDVRKAGSRAEKPVCAGPALSNLNSELKRLYGQVGRETCGRDDAIGTVTDFIQPYPDLRGASLQYSCKGENL